MEVLSPQRENRLFMLLSMLKRLPVRLETIADEIDNENLSNAFLAIADETTQYAKELQVQLKSLNFGMSTGPGNYLEDEIIENGSLDFSREKGKEVMCICESCDRFFSQLYAELFDDFLENDSLVNMMNYQLLGIKSALMRIKFLNTLRFVNYDS